MHWKIGGLSILGYLYFVHYWSVCCERGFPRGPKRFPLYTVYYQGVIFDTLNFEQLLSLENFLYVVSSAFTLGTARGRGVQNIHHIIVFQVGPIYSYSGKYGIQVWVNETEIGTIWLLCRCFNGGSLADTPQDMQVSYISLWNPSWGGGGGSARLLTLDRNGWIDFKL